MDNQHIKWLGEHATLGPEIRAGLGILLAQNNWTWWHYPSAAATIMLNAVNASGIVNWGGDPAAIEAPQWLEIDIGIEVARAFQSLIARRGGELRIKVLRDVYTWNTAFSVDDICDDLGRAFTRTRVFSEWPTDRRIRRLIPNNRNIPGISSSVSLASTANAMVHSLPEGTWMAPGQHSTIAIATVGELLENHFSCELLIVLEDSSNSVLPHIDKFRASTGAQCAIFLPSAQRNIELWLAAFGRAIASQLPIDRALDEANAQVEKHGIILASTQNFILQSSRILFPRVQRKEVNAGVNATLTATNFQEVLKEKKSRTLPPPNLEIAGVRMDSPPPTVRAIDARVECDGKVISTIPAGGQLDIFISIQPITPLRRSITPFPEQSLDWKEDQKILQVHLLELEKIPVTVPLLLPRSGASTQAAFKFIVPANGKIDLTFVISEGIGILQTARMRGFAGHVYEFYIEAMNSSVERSKAKFDVALLIQNSEDTKSFATVLTEGGITLSDNQYLELQRVRTDLLEQLRVCLEPEAAFNSALFNLANAGKLMLDALKDFAPDWPDDMKRVQLTTPSNDHFPVEFLYHGELPNNEDATLCTVRAGCLKAGVAVPNCSIRAERKQLCPMGFAGVTAVIERRTWERRTDKQLCLRQATELSQRQQIRDLQRALFAASDRADDFEDEDVPKAFPVTRNADLEALIDGWSRNNWEEWADSIKALSPKLLVLVPHIENKHLYIGKDHKLAIGSMGHAHVGNAGPVVVVIGCNSAIGNSANTGLPARLLREGAKVVIGTLTFVLGRFANTAAANLASKLITASNGRESITIGELITQLRREFLASDNAFGLALVAFGDADVYLGEQAV